MSEARRTASGVDLVVVTGPHRSGTTFLASLLAAASNTVSLVAEPLNVTWGLRSVTEWYHHVHAADAIDRDLRRIRRGRPVGWRAVGRTPMERVNSWGRGHRRNLRIMEARARGRTVILKDPFLSLSLDTAVELTSRPVIIAMRHPAAWCMSLRRVGWHPAELLDTARERPHLRSTADRLGLPDRAWADVPILESAAWLWSLLTAAIDEQQAAIGSRAILVPLEEFATDPVGRGLGLINQVGLDATPETRTLVDTLTHGSAVVPSGSRTHVLERDTSASVYAWKHRLSAPEQHLIWSIAEPIASKYYEQSPGDASGRLDRGPS